MPAIARGQTSNCANPVLDLFSSVDGIAVDLFSLEFQIFDDSGVSPVQVFPAILGNRESVAVGVDCPAVGAGRVSLGRYVATWTVPAAENVGLHRIKWFVKLTAAATEQTFEEDFDVLNEDSLALGTGDGAYVLVADLREEGVPASISDRRIYQRILLVSRMIERYTGRIFYPMAKAITVDGTGGHILQLDEPIISVSEVAFETAPFDPSSTPVEEDLLRIYNRHLSQNLLSPDDRENPKIEIYHPSYDLVTDSAFSFSRIIFPRGNQNVRVTGVFGYTEYDGSATGKTPDMIRHVAKLMVIRELPDLADAASQDEVKNGWRLTSERTRDQAYTRDGLAKRVGNFTGDPEIDNILSSFMRPPALGSA